MRLQKTSFQLLCPLLVLASIATCAHGAIGSGTPIPSAAETIPGLGTTSFQTSTRLPQAQTAFLRGLLLLHVFEYADAAKAFIAAEQLDPGFAMAYWGEAMTYNHGIWNQVDPVAGKAALEKFGPTPEARAAKIADPREKAYFTSVEVLYTGNGSKVERDKLYSGELQRISAAYPNDRNAQLFYALALLSQSEGVRDVPVYLHAAEISKAIFRLEPNNPGAAHYWIHGMDDPEHAAGALEAARALSKISPNAGHAQHMCSHIFMALGMWDEVVDSNENAMRVTTEQDKAQGFPPLRCSHYQSWLEYSYFQQGRLHAAEQTIAECHTSDTEGKAWVLAHPQRSIYGSKSSARVHLSIVRIYAWMREVGVVETRDWNGATGGASNPIDTAELEPGEAAWWDFVRGLAAAERGDGATASGALDAMRAKTEQFRKGANVDPQASQDLGVGLLELSGFAHVKAGHADEGITDLRKADETYRAMAFAFGPPSVIKPPAELLGEVLLEKGDAAAARQAFERSLERAPKRTESLVGLARAEKMAGDRQAARKTYASLLSIWHSADPDYPELKEAKLALQ